MKRIVCVFSLFTLIFVYCESINAETNKRMDPFQYTIFRVLEGISKKDSLAVNRFVHPDIGVYIVHRIGVADTYTHIDRVDLSNPVPDYLGDYLSGAPNLQIYVNDSSFEYDCDNESWNLGVGIYANINHRDNRLSLIDEFRIQNGETEFSDEIRESHTILDGLSVRIIVITESEESLVFYLTKVNDEWYLSIIDRAATDCGA